MVTQLNIVKLFLLPKRLLQEQKISFGDYDYNEWHRKTTGDSWSLVLQECHINMHMYAYAESSTK